MTIREMLMDAGLRAQEVNIQHEREGLRDISRVCALINHGYSLDDDYDESLAALEHQITTDTTNNIARE